MRVVRAPVRPGRIVPLALCYRRRARRERMEKIHGSRTRLARRLVPRATIVQRTALPPSGAARQSRRPTVSPGHRFARAAPARRKLQNQATTPRAARKAHGRARRRASRGTVVTSACGTRAHQGHTNPHRPLSPTRSTRRSAGPALPVTIVRGRRALRSPAPRERTAKTRTCPLPRVQACASAATTARKLPYCRLRVPLERLGTRPGSRRRRARRRAFRTRPGNVALLSVRRGTIAPLGRRMGGSVNVARACTARAGPAHQ